MVSLLLSPCHACGWGSEGHEIIGAVAWNRLASKSARLKVKQLLGEESLGTASTWADAVKKLEPWQLKAPLGSDQRALAGDPDSIAFVERFHPQSDPRTHKLIQGSMSWHYVDIPIGASGYNDPVLRPPMRDRVPLGDVVGKIGECIRILQDEAAGDSGAFGKRNALRMLVHLAGDIHQPLHVGCCYISRSAATPSDVLVKDPRLAQDQHSQSDEGGNLLFLSRGRAAENLHRFWDDDLVKDAVATTPGGRAAYTGHLSQEPPDAGWNLDGPMSEWAVRCANDSLIQARRAYDGIVVSDISPRSVQTPLGTASGFAIQLPFGYEADMSRLADLQLAKAGYRLARLLDQIWPDP